jgi:hypothetical protein
MTPKKTGRHTRVYLPLKIPKSKAWHFYLKLLMALSTLSCASNTETSLVMVSSD